MFGYPPLPPVQFTYEAVNPYHMVPTADGKGERPSRFRDTVLAVSRFDAQRKVEWMGLQDVKILVKGQ